ncbi:type 1 glutamine amidotransferase family protein [Streptococcus macacae]|uniref:DJ-1/PfpI family protein n=1 Tax=Streptococcus macacae NCTC 11558 TaxID=764298 RepID=G5JYB5_9STRE|nr:type 1 glutamine amidotransferase family protein [Streptococcus macacae]EHJ52537.1 DJ-1/PfpI family protein [Streptococcus macacae NCTC 11558]SUN78029.1 intracellular protease [Streptococcus macacae NCTC 11558]
MKNDILVYIFDGYADWEPAYVCSELNRQDSPFQIKTIGANKQPKKSMGGFCLIPDYDISDYPEDFKMLIIPGGDSWLAEKNTEILPVVDYAAHHRILLAAICAATNFLAQNGYLDHVKHTGNTLELMKENAPHYQGEDFYVEEQAVSDGGIVTANGTAALEFAREIMLLLDFKNSKEIKDWYDFNKLGFHH